MTKNIVICGFLREYVLFLRSKGVNSHEYPYVSRKEQIAGYVGEGLTIYFVGDYYRNPLASSVSIELLVKLGAKRAYASV